MMDTDDRQITLQHERLGAYASVIAHRSGRGQGWLADHAMRASAGAMLNLAEALGREGADRARGLRIARGSVLELDAALAMMLHRGACRKFERKALKNRAAP